ncbi:hypothetical protein B0H14DRAFT_3873969 [Mycena olivaceomarginata]|nr:hypothetical protein B0H14DRAFT_3873969 [Mycena olivaceomarginata]
MQPPFVNPSEASEPLAQNCRQLLSNWPSLAGPVLVFYDYILMLPTEMHLIWRHPKPWFLLIRYLALATNIIVVVSTFGNFGPEEIIIYAILTLRVYALFNRHQAILVLLSVVGLGSLAIGVWLGTTTDTTAPPPGKQSTIHFTLAPNYLDSLRWAIVSALWRIPELRELVVLAAQPGATRGAAVRILDVGLTVSVRYIADEAKRRNDSPLLGQVSPAVHHGITVCEEVHFRIDPEPEVFTLTPALSIRKREEDSTNSAGGLEAE